MSTITATPQPATASIALTVNPVGSTGVQSIMRTDANGTRAVRTAAGVLPITTSTVVIDYEPALTGPVFYEGFDGNFQRPTVTTALDLVGQEWLTVPVLPAFSAKLDPRVGRTAYTATRATTTTVHDVINRADQPVTLGLLRLRAGTFEAWAPDHPGARTLEDVYSHGEIVFLRQGVPGMDMYHVGTSTSLSPLLPTARWSLTVNFQEVPWPSTKLVGTLGWEFQDVPALYATFDALPLVYATFNDLTIGPT